MVVASERPTAIDTNNLVVAKMVAFVSSRSTGIEITTFDIIGTITTASTVDMLMLTTIANHTYLPARCLCLLMLQIHSGCLLLEIDTRQNCGCNFGHRRLM